MDDYSVELQNSTAPTILSNCNARNRVFAEKEYIEAEKIVWPTETSRKDVCCLVELLAKKNLLCKHIIHINEHSANTLIIITVRSYRN